MRNWLKQLRDRPGGTQALRLGGKLLLLQIIIEIPFLIIEAGLLFGALAAGGLALWKSALLVAVVYLLIESGFWLLQRWRGNHRYRWFESELVVFNWAWSLLRSRLRPAS
jgi:hypothetical protein